MVATLPQDSLNQLMVKLEKTDPYFIRCIKPNKVQAPGRFESSLVLAQLRYTGMVETIRIRALGYSLRVSFDAFYAQYGLAHRCGGEGSGAGVPLTPTARPLWTLAQCPGRFFACMPAKAVATDAPVRDKCQAILDAAKLGPPDCQLGKTMVSRTREASQMRFRVGASANRRLGRNRRLCGSTRCS